MAGNGDSGISRGAVSRSMALHQMRNIAAEEYFEKRNSPKSKRTLSSEEIKELKEKLQKSFPECSTLQEFTDAVLSAYTAFGDKKISLEKSYNVGTLSEALVNYLNINKIKPNDLNIVIADFIVYKYIGHKKTKKDAVLPLDEMHLVEEAIREGSSLFVDRHSKNDGKTVFIYMKPYNQTKILKIGVEINSEKLDGKGNLLKHIGVVDQASVAKDAHFVPI